MILLRILFATYWSIPKEGRLNRYLNLLKKELEQHGHQVDILAHHPGMQQIYMQSDCRRDEFARDLIGLSVDKPKIKNVIYSEVYGYYQNICRMFIHGFVGGKLNGIPLNWLFLYSIWSNTISFTPMILFRLVPSGG